ncbi:ABC transporter ATP-binding protein [Microbacterium horticulturae]|uniref:ABC transporter ATP-binding protein n=1 Tax=Microbacterium horticulturae TaxID=3028316 RepID=A0ABY8C0A6_9MICO|nr:ABC transporter ATP-binding protein [Microbacterium sp. KACC 23027]WEG09167.1 ABC transporter ATP-binding protein [Microbacterium sp. KACC 23027]
MGNDPSSTTSKSLGRLWRLVRFSLSLVWSAARAPFIWLITLQLFGAGLLAAQVLSVQWVLNGILALGTPAASIPQLVAGVAALALLTAGSAVIGSVQSFLSRYVGESVARAMWQRLLDVSTGVGLKQFESPEFFDRLERVRTSALTQPFQVTNGVIAVIGATVTGIALAVTLATFNPLLLPLLLLSGIPIIFTSRRESRLEFRFNVAQTQPQRQRAYTSLLLTGRDEAKEVRAFGLARTLRARFNALYDRYLADLKRHLRHRAGYNVTGQLVSAIVLGLTLLVLVWLISSNGLSVATAGAALVAVRSLATQVQALASGVQTIFESGLFIDDLQEFMTLAPQRSDAETTADPFDFDKVIADDIAFTYPGRTDPAVDGVSIRIGKGEVVALVGENGSGKTTLAKIMAGLYPVDSGRISWDETDARDLPPGTIRASTAVIFQDFVRYAMDGRTNIALGRADAKPDEARVFEAARASGADDFLRDLPDGYDTPLTRWFDGGHDLSGGQWQRVAIARAFYRDAPLVVLDEPSSALDPRAEYDLFSSLRKTIRGKSALVISHRFSTVRNADRIYVMDSGRIVESGSHDELMALDGVYAELFTLQAAAYLPEVRDE